MAHFNTTFHTASGALANGGIRHDLGEISVQSARQSEHIPSKLRRLSRPNTIEEIRRKRHKRNKKERERYRGMSKREKRSERERKMQERFNIEQESRMKKLVVRVHKERKRAVDFWRLWDKEKMLRSTSNM